MFTVYFTVGKSDIFRQCGETERMMRKNNGERRESLREIVSRKLDIQPDIIPGGSLFEVRGRSSMTVSGCGKILLYTPQEIRLSLKKSMLSVKGSSLICTSYYAGAVGIDGCIDSISFIDAEKNDCRE